ncbi:hypothetical protein GCM10011519_31370 [Marmoricola endophyticus]|uniref:Phage shock protein PspC N-terminal domain-containing protein n=1 Tax=Marmoricola endophyticus TaxID=2040280 RepID=A0A917BQR8_9ACTN|nr:PspC domain-containing protein [Marmoricola endophyticus]GGF55212.1 hypothetical protein GCM10011519_31370 [Marmoricola endophyticus]
MDDETRPIQGDGDERGTTATNPPPPASDPDTGPRVTGAQARDLDRLRRSADERRLGGVCGGLARHLDVDPTVVRVVTVVLALVGGAGLLLYAGAWLFVPDERSGRAVIHLEGGARVAALVVVGVIGALTALGQGWGPPLGGGWFFLTPFPLLVVLVVLVGVWMSRRSAHPTTASADPTPVAATAAAPAPSPPAGTTAGRLLPSYTPPRPRSGPILFWPTLAVIAVALGALGLYDASGGPVADGAYPALTLALTGAALLVGAFWGRPGGLVLLALVGVASTALGVVVGSTPSGQEVRPYPTSAAQVAPSYGIGNGTLTLDLSRVSDPAALDGRTIDLTARSGVVEVVLPRGVGARVEADVDLAGAIELPTSESAVGFAPHLAGEVPAAAGAPTLDLDIDSRLGAITVRSQS